VGAPPYGRRESSERVAGTTRRGAGGSANENGRLAPAASSRSPLDRQRLPRKTIAIERRVVEVRKPSEALAKEGSAPVLAICMFVAFGLVHGVVRSTARLGSQFRSNVEQKFDAARELEQRALWLTTALQPEAYSL
jgi:hypothetical protein